MIGGVMHGSIDELERRRKLSEQHLAVTARRAGESCHDFNTSVPEPRLNASDEVQSIRHEAPCDAATKTSKNFFDWQGSLARSRSYTGHTSMICLSGGDTQQAQVNSGKSVSEIISIGNSRPAFSSTE